MVSYSDLLTWFFTHTDPTEHHKKQYQSAILYVDAEQKELAESAVAEEQVGCVGSSSAMLTKADLINVAVWIILISLF